MRTCSFGSDNQAGAHPEVLAALARANDGAAPAYGADEITTAARDRLREVFGCPEMEVLFTFSGTGANVLSLALALDPAQAALCADVSHLFVDEAAAPERLLGCKLLPLRSRDGKIAPADLEPYLGWFGDHHRPQAGLVSLTQATEYGTVYTLDELRAWREAARTRGLRVHLDGARLANAAAALGVGPADLLEASGAAAVSLGGTKNGLLYGEAVLLPRPLRGDLARAALHKQTLQQASKMRFIAAQFLALFDGDLWLKSAAHANAMARRLGDGLARHPHVGLTRPVEANAVFAAMPRDLGDALAAEFGFGLWEPAQDEYRLMCSFATRAEDVDELVRRAAQPAPPRGPA